MKSFQAKIGWKRVGKRENKKLSFRFVPTRCVIGWKRMRNIENKNFRSISFLPDA